MKCGPMNLPLPHLAHGNSYLLRLSFGGAFNGSIGRWIPPRETTLLRYVQMLIQAYATARHTFEYFERASMRCKQAGLTNAAEFILRKAEEERGHERLAALDLSVLGYSAIDAERVAPPLRSRDLFGLLRHYTNVDHPISCLGYAFALEYYANFRDSTFMADIERVVPQATKANRCFAVHSGEGSDSLHMAELNDFVDSLDTSLFVHVLAAAYETATILSTPVDDDFLSDREIELRYRDARTQIQ